MYLATQSGVLRAAIPTEGVLKNADELLFECAIPLLTLTFLNCHNAELEDAPLGPSPKWLRRSKQPAIRYRTIHVHPLHRKHARADTTGVDTGHKRGLHLARCHLRVYKEGESAGLFGRGQYGTFIIPAHTRGSLEHGKVVSTYNVKVPCNS